MPQGSENLHAVAQDVGPAPWWHTALLVGVIIGVSATGTFLAWFKPSSSLLSPGGSRIGTIYLPMIAAQCGLAFYVCRAGRGRSYLGRLLGETPYGVRGIALDVGLATVGWLAILVFNDLCSGCFACTAPGSPDSFLPRTLVEKWAWVLVALSAGFC